MDGLKNKVYGIIRYFIRDFNNSGTVRLFFRALVLFALIKMLMLWSFSRRVMAHHDISLPKSWPGKLILAPAFLADYNIEIFFGVAMIFLVVAFFTQAHYATTILFFWLSLNLYVVFLPFGNGADLVLFMLALWCIPMARRPTFKSEPGITIQKTSYNMAILLCQLQVIFIYLISGWDKLVSETWRSGEAFDYIIHLNTLYNPVLTGVFENAFIQRVLSWTTIIFELSFVGLVWIEKTRLPILGLGIIFHLFIWIAMSLPDFALIMMISYIIFLKDTDFRIPRLHFLKASSSQL